MNMLARSFALTVVALVTICIPLSAWGATMTFPVTTTADSGPGSLRQAIIDANANPGFDTINFMIGAGVQTIAPLSFLGQITDPVLIDGTSQPGYTGSPLIEISGVNVSTSYALWITAGNSTVQGLMINNWSNGIILEANGNNVVRGNYLGLDSTGTMARGNGVGVYAPSSNNLIGGTTPSARNIIVSDNPNSRGVSISAYPGGPPVTGNVVQGNFIGTNAARTAVPPGGTRVNGTHAIEIANTSNNTIGGNTPSARNVLSGHRGIGVLITGDFGVARDNVVQGNFIGTQSDGISPLGNGIGVDIIDFAHNNVIGGAVSGAGNVIAFNEYAGVAVVCFATPCPTPPTGNAVLANSIHSTFNTSLGFPSGLGIELVANPQPVGELEGVTPNDPGDADAGPNNLQNFPDLLTATSVAGVTTITGTLNSTPNTTFRIEFFSNRTCDPSGHGEGESFLGFNNVPTDSMGNVAFTAIFNTTLASGSWVTATATDPGNNTSEFSNCVEVNPLPAVVRSLTLAPVTATNTVGSSHTVTATVTDTPGGPVQGVTVHFDISLANTTSGMCTTLANGQCSFSYTGSNVGTDMITAFADSDGNGMPNPDPTREPSAEATKLWTPQPPTPMEPGFATGGGQVPGSGGGRATFGFNAHSNPTPHGECTVVDRSTKPATKVKCTDVASVTVVPNLVTGGGTATITGSGTINGQAMTYQIVTTDVAEPGAGSDSFTIQTLSGPAYTAGGTLLTGNVQIHR